MNRTELDTFLRQIRMEERALPADTNQRMQGAQLRFADTFRFLSQPSRQIKLTTHGRFLPTPPHSHDYVEIMYIYDGSITQRWAEGERQLRRGDFFFLPPGIAHSTDTCGAGDIAVNIILSPELLTPEFLGAVRFSPRLKSWLTEVTERTAAPLTVSGDTPAVRETVCRMMAEGFDPDGASGEAVELLFSLLLLELGRTDAEQAENIPHKERGEKETLYRIIRYIESEYRTVTLSEAAARFGYTPNYLSTLLKNELGQNFSDFRHSFCMAQAALLLRESELPVTEIASQSGFVNMTHFYKLFARTFHCTPAEYRERHKQSS